MTDVGILRGDIGGPPLQLPTFGEERSRIRITPGATAKAKPDPWAGWTDEGPSSDAAPIQVKPAPATPAATGNPWAGWTDQGPNSDAQVPPQIGLGEAAAMGARSGLTAGAYPFMKGAAAAAPQITANQFFSQPNPEYGGLAEPEASMTPKELAVRNRALAGEQKAFRETRDTQQRREEAAAAQHPIGYYGSEFLSGIAPALLSGGTTTAADAGLATQMGRAALGGMGYGGLSGAGGALSEGEAPQSVARRAALGAGIGLVLGGAGGAIGEGLIRGGEKVGRLFRGATDAETEAARQVAGQLKADTGKFGYAITPGMEQAATEAGLPLGLIDIGAQGTRDLARVAASSSEGAQTFKDFFDRRLGAGQRLEGFVRRITGGARAADDREALELAATSANNAAYKTAYAAGDRPIRSAELDRLLGDPEVVDAVKSAVSRGQSFATRDRLGAFRPGVSVTDDGRIVFNKGPSGTPAYPNIQFWDYVQRHLRSQADKYARSGDKTMAGVVGGRDGIRAQLNTELDRLVPEFGKARGGAAKHFAAQDAYEAGQNFVGDKNIDLDVAAKHIASLNRDNRELFARGFASELANQFDQVRYDLPAINKAFVDTPRARKKIAIAFGGTRAAQLESLLRVEAIAHQSASVLKGSPTARNLFQYAAHGGGGGVAGAGAVGAYEMVQHGELNPKSMLVGALVMGGLKGYAKHIDTKVASKIADMLVSDDPKVLAAGARSLVRNKGMFDNLRAATRTSANLPAMFGARHPVGTTAVGGALMHEGEGEAEEGGDPYFGTYYGTEKRQ